MRSEIDMTMGMSCSMIRIDAPSSRWMVWMSGPNASVSRCATPAVGSSSNNKRESSAMSAPNSTMRRVPVESSPIKASAYRPRPR